MLLKFINSLYARGLYVGNIPGAPGTWGSILACFLLICFPEIFSNILVLVLLFFTGVISSSYETKITNIHDDGRIVIDEILGLFVVFIGIPHKFWLLILGFFMFRFFDIIKPLWIADSQKLSGGWGIMTDDLLAGIVTNIILRVIVIYIF